METAHPPTREQLLHRLYEAAELEHTLMCTYLYAAFSLRQGDGEGLSALEALAVARWREQIVRVAVEEMGHLTAVWNITAALGGAPRFGRDNFPLSPGVLPAGVVVKLAPFNEATLQHFIHLERPEGSSESDGEGFAADFKYVRSVPTPRLTPMGLDYDTVGTFYATLSRDLSTFVERVGEKVAFSGDPALQWSQDEVALAGARPVLCAKTALNAFSAIVRQGEGAPSDAADSHYQRFLAIRAEFRELKAKNPGFCPAFPAATNPVLRMPVHPVGRVFIEDERSAALVDVANSAYGLMLRMLSYSYTVPRPSEQKALLLELSLGLMHAMTLLAEQAARMPAGAAHPGVNAGMSFTSLRDAAAFPHGRAVGLAFVERLSELAEAAKRLENVEAPRTLSASRQLAALLARARRAHEQGVFGSTSEARVASLSEPQKPGPLPESTVVAGVERVEGEKLSLMFEAKKCIHARFCVTGAPKVFLANVQGPWLYPDAMEVEGLVAIAHACPSGAIRYRRKDGRPDEAAPPVNLIAVREAGPYAVRADIQIAGERVGYRATLCRCGASKNKPYCDGSHHDVQFAASGEPPTGAADMLPVRDGVLAIEPQQDGPLRVRGNLEITSGTGRVVARVTNCVLCRCGGSQNKPFCDGTHAKIGFKSS